MSKELPAPRLIIPKLFGFLLVVCGFFTAVGFYFPQKMSAPPEAKDYKKMKSVDELVAYGKDLAFSPGMGCTSCHGIGDPSKSRCPDWDGMGQKAVLRNPKPGQSPEENAVAYLHDSILRPSEFIVDGFQDIMKVPKFKDERDVYAMAAFLMSLGGKPSEELLKKVQAMPEPKKTKEKPIWAISPEDHGKKIIEEAGGCMNCHAVGNDDDPTHAKVGPSLTHIASRSHEDPKNPGKMKKNDYGYLLESIHLPDKVISKGCNGDPEGACVGGVMPKTFVDEKDPTYMSESYVKAITAYLWKLDGKKYKIEDMKAAIPAHLLPKRKSVGLPADHPVKWTPEAVGLLNESVPFARPFIQSSVERYIRKRGLDLVSPALYEEAREKNRPPFVGARPTKKEEVAQ